MRWSWSNLATKRFVLIIFVCGEFSVNLTSLTLLRPISRTRSTTLHLGIFGLGASKRQSLIFHLSLVHPNPEYTHYILLVASRHNLPRDMARYRAWKLASKWKRNFDPSHSRSGWWRVLYFMCHDPVETQNHFLQTYVSVPNWYFQRGFTLTGVCLRCPWSPQSLILPFVSYYSMWAPGRRNPSL
jgi:hypothetical protein